MIAILLASVMLVSGGAPKATIVVPDRPTLNERFAAGELRYWVREITGATLPVAEASASPAGARVCIGPRLAADAFAGDLKVLDGTEGFAVRERNGDLYLFGAKPCGNCFAVYDLLERNTDVIWPSLAKGVDRVFTPTNALVAADVGYRSVPALAQRAWSIANGYYYNDPRTEQFALRLKSGAINGSSARRRAYGFTEDDWGGHNICRFLPWNELHESHPDYFCMVDGVRREAGYEATGTCYTSPGAADELVRRFVRDRVEGGPECQTAGIGIEDANQECCCPTCLEPIRLADGTLLRKADDPALFRSALYYRWFNRVAEKIAARHPDFALNTLAYMFTTEPPPFDLHPKAVVNFCAIGKDMRRPFDDPANATVLRQLKGWARRSHGAFSVYEYWGCGAEYPRPVSYVVQKDLPILLSNGVFRTGTEWGHSHGAEYVSALDFWVVNRLMWDPAADIEKLRDTFFSRTFREAAAEMRVFYDVVRDSWFKIPRRSSWSERPADEMAFLLRDKAAAKKAFDALAAAERKAKHPASRLFVRKIRETMDAHRAAAEKTMAARRDVEIPFASDPFSLPSPDGTAWASARTLDASEFGDAPLEAAMATDGESLWFRLRSDAAPAARGRNIWLSDHWEIFLETATKPYFHFAVDADGGAVSDRAFGRPSAVRMSVVSVQKSSDGWRAVVKIPLKGLDVKDGALRLMLVHRDGKTQRNVGWRAGEWHEPATFVKATLAAQAVAGAGTTVSVTLADGADAAWRVADAATTDADGVQAHVVSLTRQADDAAVPPVVEIAFDVPVAATSYFWQPTEKDVGLSVAGEPSKFCYGAPVRSFVTDADRSRLTMAWSECVRKVDCSQRIVHEKPGEFFFHVVLRVFTEAEAPLKEWRMALRLDFRDRHWSDAVRDASDWVRREKGFADAPPPEAAFGVVYSTWYAFNRAFDERTLERECAAAAKLGMKTLITDDGWQTTHGDWEPVPEKFADMRQHVDRVHALGLKYVLWYALPFMNEKSRHYAAFKGKYLADGPFWEHRLGILDPRFPEVREFLAGQLADRLVRWDLDGYKLDFVDFFRTFGANVYDSAGGVDPAAAEGYRGRDCKSLAEAAEALVADISKRLKAIKPDVLLEFRQPYAGPVPARYGNMLRAIDCPGDPRANRVRTTDLRLTSGRSAAVHADMLKWTPSDDRTDAARSILSALFTTVQYSMVLESIPAAQKEEIRKWIAFAEEHRAALQGGGFRAHGPGEGYPVLEGWSDAERVVAVYEPNRVIDLVDDGRRTILVNATPASRVIVRDAKGVRDLPAAPYSAIPMAAPLGVHLVVVDAGDGDVVRDGEPEAR